MSAVQVQPIDPHGNYVDTEVGVGMLHEHHTVIDIETSIMPIDVFSLTNCLMGRECIDRSSLIASGDARVGNSRRIECYDLPLPLTFAQLINDPRPADSPPMDWYYAVSVRFSFPGQCGAMPGDWPEARSAVSMTPLGFGNGEHKMIQSITTPNAEETYIYSTGRFPFSGYLHDGAIHVHGINWRKSWLFLNSPSGLWIPRATKIPMPFSEAGVTSAQLEASLWRRDPICQSIPKNVGRLKCSQTRHIEQFAQITSIGFFGGYPHNVSESGTWEQHHAAKLWYIADDRKTHNTAMVTATDELDVFGLASSLSDIARMVGPGLRSNSGFFVFVVALCWTGLIFLVGLPAMVACWCCGVAKQRSAEVALSISAVLSVLYYVWYIKVLRTSTVNPIDAALLPPPHEPLLLTTLLLPCAIGLARHLRRRCGCAMVVTQMAKKVGARLSAESKQPILEDV